MTGRPAGEKMRWYGGARGGAGAHAKERPKFSGARRRPVEVGERFLSFATDEVEGRAGRGGWGGGVAHLFEPKVGLKNDARAKKVVKLLDLDNLLRPLR